jgi:hypothetical protein
METEQGSARERSLSDEYRVTLVALGPGVAACALVFCLAQPSPRENPFLALPTLYGGFLMGSLPGLPALGFCLARAVPRDVTRGWGWHGLAWLAASAVAPLWHLTLTDLSSRLCVGWLFGPDVWWFLLRYDLCLWMATLLAWLGHVAHWRRHGPLRKRDAVPEL